VRRLFAADGSHTRAVTSVNCPAAVNVLSWDFCSRQTWGDSEQSGLMLLIGRGPFVFGVLFPGCTIEGSQECSKTERGATWLAFSKIFSERGQHVYEAGVGPVPPRHSAGIVREAMFRQL
jgi:hypothetical protein